MNSPVRFKRSSINFFANEKNRLSIRNFGEYFSDTKHPTRFFFRHLNMCENQLQQCHCSFNCNGFYREQVHNTFNTIDIYMKEKDSVDKLF